LEAVRRHVAAPVVSLIGWSYLGAIVALYAHRFPHLVRRLVLLCPMAPRPGPFEGMEAYREMRRTRQLAVQEQLDQLRLKAEQEPSAASWREYDLVQHSVRMGDPAAVENIKGNPWQYEQEWAPNVERRQQTLFGTLEKFDWRPLMKSVEAPALVVHGELDGPSVCREEWVTAFARGRLLRLPGTGHWPFVERRQELFAVLPQFLDDEVRG